jgi:uroporphyrinogen-III synthase
VKLLIVRPQPGADATAKRVEAAGHSAILMPLFAPEPIDWHLPTDPNYDGLLLTSANALRHAGEKRQELLHLPVYAVGQNSADFARSMGFHVRLSGTAGIEQLLTQVDARNLLWLAGEDRTQFVTPSAIRLDCRIVYRSAALPAPEDFADYVAQANYVLLHSARAADYFALHSARAASRFTSLVEDVQLQKNAISIGALSEKIAQAAGSGWANIRIAKEPTDNDLLSQL